MFLLITVSLNTDYWYLSVEAVANAAHGEDAAGVAGVCLDFFAQPADMNVYRAAVAIVGPAPDALQNKVAGEGNALVTGQKQNEIKLLRLEAQRLTIKPHLPPILVDFQIVEGEQGDRFLQVGCARVFTVECFANEIDAAQQRFDPG